MSTARCPKCDRQVRLPRSRSAVWVRCPLCDAEYGLDEVLEKLPPRLLVVDRTGALIGESELQNKLAQDDKLQLPTVVAKGTSKRRAKTVDASKSEFSDDAGGLDVPTPRGLRAGRVKPNAEATSMGRNVVKVVLGGIAGLLIGQLVLWWLPARFRTDPFGLAPVLPPPLAFLAPVELREANARARSVSPRDATSRDDLNAAETESTEADDKSSDVGVPESVADDTESRTDDEALGIARAPVFRLDQLRDRLQTAQAEHQSLITSETKKAVWRPWYQAQCELAHGVTYADPAEDGVNGFAAEVQQFFQGMGKELQYFESLAGGAASWFAQAESDRQGIVLAGTVQDISSVDPLYKTVVKLAGRPDSVTVISRINPEQNSFVEYQPGDRVIILGSLVANPGLYLRGYQGNDAKVVWGGLPVVVSVDWESAGEAEQASEPSRE